MEKSCFKGGFTLIELLVVVLIIGILAAIALPQYNKAVTKARLSEMHQMLATLEKAVDVWQLSNGVSAGSARYIEGELDVDFLDSFSTLDGRFHCNSKHLCFQVLTANSRVSIYTLQGIADGNGMTHGYLLVSNWRQSTGWKREAWNCSEDISTYGLQKLGYTMGSCY